MTDFMDRESAYQEQSGGAGDGYTRIYWMNGEPRDKTPGRFWTYPDKLIDAGISFDKPWKLITHTFSDGNSKDILVTPALHIAPVCWKQQTFIRDATGGVAGWVTERSFGKKMEAGQSVYFEMLTIAEGLSLPVVFSTKGIKTSMAFLADILPEYRKMRDEIKKSRGGKVVPPWWFWLAIRSDLDTNKQPSYEKTPQGKAVTPPRWIQAGDVTQRETWKAMYVGHDRADEGETTYQEAAEWVKRLISEGYSTQAEEAPAGRNVPQPITEDVPF
jgi:hypothetical protein